MRRTSSNKCSCCQKSSSSSSSSGSASRSRSISKSRSRSDSRDRSISSDSQSLSSGSGETGKCCSIPRQYIIIDETYGPTEFEEMKDWVRSQRQGREGVGLIFVGPVELRNGDWYGAVVCMGNEAGGGCDCADIEDGWQCSEGIDALTCYLEAGVPGTGIFEQGGNCEEDEDNPACPNPFDDCEVGCNGCNCCAEEAPPPGQNGVACSKFRQIVPWDILSYHYGEYIHDPDCPNGKMSELFDYLATRGFERDGLKMATFRTNEDPKDCRVEVWGELPECADGTCPEVSFAGDENPAWPGITAVPSCLPQACPILRCFEPEDINVDVMDQWQAEQIGSEFWNPDAACPCGCFPACPDLPAEPDPIDEFTVTDEGLEVIYQYEVEYRNPPDTSYTWNIDLNSGDYDCVEFHWVKEHLFYSVFNGNFGNEARTECVKFTLIGCDRVRGRVEDLTSLVTGLPGQADLPNCDQGPKNVDDLLEYSATDNTYIDENTGEFICEQGSDCGFPEGTPAFNPTIPGQWVGDNFPIEFEGQTARAKKKMETRSLPAGPGTELKKLLGRLGLPDRPGCRCNKRAKQMDDMEKKEPGWCENHLEEIVGWLREEAVKRKLPFVEWGAKIIVRRAIRNAKRAT